MLRVLVVIRAYLGTHQPLSWKGVVSGDTATVVLGNVLGELVVSTYVGQGREAAGTVGSVVGCVGAGVRCLLVVETGLDD